jgi:hypothetical protein
MRIESRSQPVPHIVLVPTSDQECRTIEEAFGKAVPTRLVGEARLSDGYGTYYLAIYRAADKWDAGRAKD